MVSPENHPQTPKPKLLVGLATDVKASDVARANGEDGKLAGWAPDFGWGKKSPNSNQVTGHDFLVVG